MFRVLDSGFLMIFLVEYTPPNPIVIIEAPIVGVVGSRVCGCVV